MRDSAKAADAALIVREKRSWYRRLRAAWRFGRLVLRGHLGGVTDPASQDDFAERRRGRHHDQKPSPSGMVSSRPASLSLLARARARARAMRARLVRFLSAYEICAQPAERSGACFGREA